MIHVSMFVCEGTYIVNKPTKGLQLGGVTVTPPKISHQPLQQTQRRCGGFFFTFVVPICVVGIVIPSP